MTPLQVNANRCCMSTDTFRQPLCICYVWKSACIGLNVILNGFLIHLQQCIYIYTCTCSSYNFVSNTAEGWIYPCGRLRQIHYCPTCKWWIVNAPINWIDLTHNYRCVVTCASFGSLFTDKLFFICIFLHIMCKTPKAKTTSSVVLKWE